jgi:hypothetical protein
MMPLPPKFIFHQKLKSSHKEKRKKGEKEMPSKRPRKRVEYTAKKSGIQKPYTLGKLTDKVVGTLDMDDLDQVAEQTVGPGGTLSTTETELYNRFRTMIKNRISARESRQRRKRERIDLKARVATLERSNRTLTDLIVDMEMERDIGPLPLAILRPPAATAFTTWQREHADIMSSVHSMESVVNDLQRQVHDLRRVVATNKKQQVKKIDRIEAIAALPLTQADTKPFYIEEVFNDRFETLTLAIRLLDRRIKERSGSEGGEEGPSNPPSPPILPMPLDVPLFSSDEAEDLSTLLSKVGTSHIFWE